MTPSVPESMGGSSVSSTPRAALADSGHSSVAITEAHYAHLDLTDLAEDADMVMAVRRWENGL
jgi:hypothetical protein